jgi:hypothetical protein
MNINVCFEAYFVTPFPSLALVSWELFAGGDYEGTNCGRICHE